MAPTDPPRRTEADIIAEAANAAGSLAAKIGNQRTPTHPIYDSANFPHDPIDGQIVRDQSDLNALWTYQGVDSGGDDRWHKIGGALTDASPASTPIPISLNKLVRFPGGVVGLRAASYQADPSIDRSTTTGLQRSGDWLNPTGGSVVRLSGGGFVDLCKFIPIDDFGLPNNTAGTIWIGYRVRSGTSQIKALCDDYTGTSGILWNAGDDTTPLVTSPWFGYQGMGFGYLGAFSPRYHTGNAVTIQANGNIDIDWILGIPSAGYYFYGGQGTVGTASGRNKYP